MKKYLIVFITTMVFTVSAMAQFEVGVEIGQQFNKLNPQGIDTNVSDLVSTESSLSYALYADYLLSDKWLLSSGIKKSQYNSQIQQGTNINLGFLNLPIAASANSELHAISVPLQVGYYHITPSLLKLSLSAGPQLEYLSKGRLYSQINTLVDINTSDTQLDLGSDLYNRWNVGIGARARVSYPIDNQLRISGSLAYNKGLGTILNVPAIDLKAKYDALGINAGISYVF